MKKALVILLALTMVMSMFAMVPVSAADEELAIGQVAADYKPEGTAVNNAAEFAAMDPAGTYYLAADIEISETYGAIFTGTFDGNGKTVTTSVPLFEQVDGTAKNVTIVGAINMDAASSGEAETWIGALAKCAGNTAAAVIDNVCNKASITSAELGIGGIVGMVSNDEQFDVVISNCANYGSITASNSSSSLDCGGIVGQFDGDDNIDRYYLQFINCYNYGTINACGRPGGIIGYANASTMFKGCYNAGEIQSTANYCGGIAGRTGTDAGQGNLYLLEDCVNDGKVIVFQSQGAGLVGYAGGVGELVFKNCTNNGDVVVGEKNHLGKVNLAGFLGSSKYDTGDETKQIQVVIAENCVNNGNIGSEGVTSTADINRGGLFTNLLVDKTFKAINCVNNGNLYAETTTTGYAGGIVSYLRAPKNDPDAVVITGCINNGDITAQSSAGGIIGHEGNGDFCPVVNLVACGNTGNIRANKNYAAGLIGYSYGNLTAGYASFDACFNTGDISSAKFASGMLAYTNTTAAYFKNCYVAGTIKTDLVATPVVTGATVAIQTPYSYEGASGTRYFLAPSAGTVAISGDTVTFTATTALNNVQAVATGDEVAKNVIATFTGADGKLYAAHTPGAGVITVDADNKTITVGGVVANAVEWTVAADNATVVLATYDKQVYSTAFGWINNSCINTGYFNFVAEGTADINYVVGMGNKWNVVGATGNDATVATEADFTSGKVAYELNASIGENMFYQNIDSNLFAVDAYPTTDAAHAKVVYLNGQYQNQLFDMNNDEGSPATGDAMIYVVVALAVSTISLAAVAVVKKVKEN